MFGEYVAKPFFPSCAVPQNIVKLLAAICLCLLTAINCMSTKLTMWVDSMILILACCLNSLLKFLGKFKTFSLLASFLRSYQLSSWACTPCSQKRRGTLTTAGREIMTRFTSHLHLCKDLLHLLDGTIWILWLENYRIHTSEAINIILLFDEHNCSRYQQISPETSLVRFTSECRSSPSSMCSQISHFLLSYQAVKWKITLL